MIYADLLQAALRQHGAVPAALGALRERGASPAEAAQAVCAVTGANVGDARALVRQSGVWSSPRGAAGGGARNMRPEPVGCHGRSGHGAATVLPYLVLPYVVRPGQGGNNPRA